MGGYVSLLTVSWAPQPAAVPRSLLQAEGTLPHTLREVGLSWVKIGARDCSKMSQVLQKTDGIVAMQRSRMVMTFVWRRFGRPPPVGRGAHPAAG
jgi:hypothetical protein